MKIDNRFLIVIVIVVGLYATFVIVSDVSTIIVKITQFQVEYIPAIISLVTATWFILFVRWHLLLKNSDLHIPKKDSFLIYLSGVALTIIPGKVGELVKSQLLKSKFGISRTTTAPIVLAEQLYTVVGIFIVSMFGIWNFELGIYIMIIFGALLAIVFFLISSKKFFNKFLCLINKIKFLSKFTEPLTDSYDVIKKSTRGRIFIYSSSLSALFWLVESITVYLILLSFNIDTLEFLTLVPTYTASIILGVASFLPLGIGVVEGSLAGFLTLQGIDGSIALTLVIIIRIFTRWYSVSIGFIALKITGGLSMKTNSEKEI